MFQKMFVKKKVRKEKRLDLPVDLLPLHYLEDHPRTCKWLVIPIYKPFRPSGRGTTLLRGHRITMIINHLQVLGWSSKYSLRHIIQDSNLESPSSTMKFRTYLKNPCCFWKQNLQQPTLLDRTPVWLILIGGLVQWELWPNGYESETFEILKCSTLPNWPWILNLNLKNPVIHHVVDICATFISRPNLQCCPFRFGLVRETFPQFTLIWVGLVVVSIIFFFHPYLEKSSNLTNVFQMGWIHQPG